MRKYQVLTITMTQADGVTLEWEGLSEEVSYRRTESQGPKYTEIMGESP